MIFGLTGAIGIMLVEMSIFIIRAVRMENVFEKKPSVSVQMHKYLLLIVTIYS